MARGRRLELPQEVCSCVVATRRREPRGDLIAGQKSAEGIVAPATGRRPERLEWFNRDRISGVKSDRKTRNNWTCRSSRGVKLQGAKRKGSKRPGRGEKPRTRLATSDGWRKYVRERIEEQH